MNRFEEQCKRETRVETDRVQRNSFLIRIWREPNQAGWRGWVQHIPTGEATFVRNLAEMQAFLERWAGELHPPPSSGLR